MTLNALDPRLILASQSPIRAQLLARAGLVFETMPAHVEESVLIAKSLGSQSKDIALSLAEAKAKVIAEKRPADLVIGADQILVFEDRLRQKPADMTEARQRLVDLAGRGHQLVTATALVQGDQVIWRHADIAQLTMHAVSQAEIEDYLALEGHEILQSVGAYRLEGPGISLFSALEGDYFAMLGLPLVPLLGAIRRQARHLLFGAKTE